MVKTAFLLVQDAASQIGVSPATIWRWVKQGRLTTRRVLGRVVFDPAEVGKLASERRRQEEARS